MMMTVGTMESIVPFTYHMYYYCYYCADMPLFPLYPTHKEVLSFHEPSSSFSPLLFGLVVPSSGSSSLQSVVNRQLLYPSLELYERRENGMAWHKINILHR